MRASSISYLLCFFQQVEACRASSVRIFCCPGQMWTKNVCVSVVQILPPLMIILSYFIFYLNLVSYNHVLLPRLKISTFAFEAMVVSILLESQ